MDKIFRLVVFLCVGFGCGSVQAGLILAGNDAAHIALGNQGSNQSVGWVSSSGGRGGFTVIDDGLWGISSYHVTSNDPTRNTFFNNIQLGFGNSLSPTQSSTAFQIFANPTKDMALFKFDVAFTGIIPLQRFQGFVARGTEGFTVGYGSLQYLNEATSVYTGDRRAGFDVVDGINLFEPENFRTTFNSTINANYRNLEMGLRPGDSGGAFISNGLLAGASVNPS